MERQFLTMIKIAEFDTLIQTALTKHPNLSGGFNYVQVKLGIIIFSNGFRFGKRTKNMSEVSPGNRQLITASQTNAHFT